MPDNNSLDDFRASTFNGPTFRFGNKVEVDKYPDIETLTSKQLRQFVEFMQPSSLMTVEGFLDYSFNFPKPGRFSDGSYGVYSSALDRETAKIEARDFFIALVSEGTITCGFAYYRCFSAQFSGKVLDLQGRSTELTYLVDDEGWDQCRKLAAHARDNGIDGFLTSSAARARRSQVGTCLPVFNRTALSMPTEDGKGEKFTLP